jgi:hypothetical protein
MAHGGTLTVDKPIEEHFGMPPKGSCNCLLTFCLICAHHNLSPSHGTSGDGIIG